MATPVLLLPGTTISIPITTMTRRTTTKQIQKVPRKRNSTMWTTTTMWLTMMPLLLMLLLIQTPTTVVVVVHAFSASSLSSSCTTTGTRMVVRRTESTPSPPTRRTTRSSTTTALSAIASLFKRAKLADVQRIYGMDTNDDAEPTSSSDNDPTTTTSGGTLQRDNPTLFATVQALRTQVVLAAANANAQPETTTKNPGPLQTALTKRRGTLTVLAEYKRKLAAASSSLSANTAATTNAGSSSASITTNSWDVEFLSPVFREFGAAAMAVLADPRLGQCSADDVARAVAEQTRGAATRPQPALPVVNSDILLLTRASVAPGSSSQQEQQQCYYAHWQMAHSAALGAAAIVLHCDYLLMDSSSSSSSSSSTNEEKEEDPQSLVLWQDNVSLLASLMRAAAAVQLECVVAVSSLAQAELALAAGAQILSVTNGAGASVAEKKACIPDEHWLTTNSNICKIAHISTPTPSSSSTDKSNSSSNKSLSDEIEQAWAIRDAGFQCAWVSDALYKLLDVSTEHPGAIIQAMRNKASLKFASPQAKSGRGEGAREYLGDILM